MVDVNFEWGSLEPMREYKMNHLEDKEGFIAQHDNFWMILEAETDAETGERKLVEPYKFKDFNAERRYDDGTFVAIYYGRRK